MKTENSLSCTDVQCILQWMYVDRLISFTAEVLGPKNQKSFNIKDLILQAFMYMPAFTTSPTMWSLVIVNQRYSSIFTGSQFTQASAKFGIDKEKAQWDFQTAWLLKLLLALVFIS